MPTYEGLRLKILKYWRIGFADYRKKKLKSTDFTIISNNCWGGMIYESYNLPKESPTVGMFFIAKDYIEFLSDIKGYVNGKLDRWEAGYLTSPVTTPKTFLYNFIKKTDIRQ